MNPDDIRQLIEAGLPGAKAVVLSPDNTHFEAQVVWEGFAGKKLIEQHRLVNETLGERMGRDIHALSLRTRTP